MPESESRECLRVIVAFCCQCVCCLNKSACSSNLNLTRTARAVANAIVLLEDKKDRLPIYILNFNPSYRLLQLLCDVLNRDRLKTRRLSCGRLGGRFWLLYLSVTISLGRISATQVTEVEPVTILSEQTRETQVYVGPRLTKPISSQYIDYRAG